MPIQKTFNIDTTPGLCFNCALFVDNAFFRKKRNVKTQNCVFKKHVVS